MKARHHFWENSTLPREKSRGGDSILQMKICKENMVSKISRAAIFNDCSAAEIELLVGELNLRVREYAPREIVIHECVPATDVVVVLSGTLFVYECGLADDSRHLVQRLYSNDSFGSMLPALALKEYPGMLVAEKTSEVMFIGVEGVRRLLNQGAHPKFLANLYTSAANQGYCAWRKLMLLSCYEISDRVLLYLRWRKDDGLPSETPFRYSELASYLGVNRTALYRAIDKLRAAKKIVATATSLRLANNRL